MSHVLFILVFVLLTPLIFIQHEGAHAITAKLLGATITKFKWWPFSEPPYTYIYVSYFFSQNPPPNARGIIAAAPMLVNFFSILLICLSCCWVTNPLLFKIIGAWCLLNLADLHSNISAIFMKKATLKNIHKEAGCYPDIIYTEKMLGLPRAIFQITALFLLTVCWYIYILIF